MPRPRTLSEHLLVFVAKLRQRGFAVGPRETIDSIRALEALEWTDAEDFRLALRLNLCSSPEELVIFDQEFEHYFGKKGLPVFTTWMAADAVRDLVKDGVAEESSAQKPGGLKQGAEDQEISRSAGIAVLDQRNRLLGDAKEQVTAVIPHQEFDVMLAAAGSFNRTVRLERSRRWKQGGKGRKIDLRGTIRRSLQTGGEPVDVARKEKKRTPAKYLLLCDGSRSMSGFAESFLQFAYALSRATRKLELFLFSTRLKRVTPQLFRLGMKGKPVLDLHGAEWGGGTRIGESLDAFVKKYGSSLLDKRTIVIIASDGLDTGAIDQLQSAMKTLQKKAACVVWLNPLLAIPGYEPKARGMQAALPYIDIFSLATEAKDYRVLATRIKSLR